MDKVENQGDHGVTESVHRLDEVSEFKFLWYTRVFLYSDIYTLAIKNTCEIFKKSKIK